MARPIPEGEYLIVSVRNTSVALDVNHAGTSNGSNIQVWTILNNRAQLFTIRYNSDDTVRILAAFTGKSVDVNGGNIVDGTNVQQWTNNDTRAQKWVLADTGNTITFRDIVYNTYKIQIAADTNFVLDVSAYDASPGRNCMLYHDQNLTDQQWFFVPRPPLSSGGVYELHSMLNTNLVVDISSGSKSDGANALIWPTHGGNNQKFVLMEEDTDKWRIRNVHSGKYLDIKGNEARNNASVVQWGEPANVRHQQWKILVRDTHTHLYKGVECVVVSLGAYGNSSDGNTYMMHTKSAANANDVDILADEGTNAFRWLLYPTEATDPFIPIPANLGLSKTKGGTDRSTKVDTGSFYATWTCTQSWTNSSPNHYQWRMRKRYMSSMNSTWGEWSDYNAWETANCYQVGTQAWLADPIDGTYDIDGYKNLQVQFQVRCVGVDETANLVGETATQDFYFIFQPTFTFDGAGISPAGLTVGYSNDYPYGMSTLYIDEVLVDGENILTQTVVADALDSTGSFTIPAESMTRLVPDGSTVEIVYRAATDQATAGESKEATVGADEDAGKTIDAEPKLRSGSGRTLVASLPYPDARMWLKTPDGIVELENQGGSLGEAYACGEVVETQDAIGRMTSLHIDGKSVQDGTPSPSAPVPIKSVQGNVTPFFSKPLSDNAYWFTTTNLQRYGTQLEDGWAHFALSNLNLNVSPKIASVDVKPNTRYTIVLEVRNVTKCTNVNLYTYTQDNSAWAATVTVPVSGEGRYFATATTKADPYASNVTHLRIFVGSTNCDIDFDMRLALYEGSTAYPYVPYGNVGLWAKRTSDASDYTVTPIPLDGHELRSLPDGTRDEVTVDERGRVTLVQRVGSIEGADMSQYASSGGYVAYRSPTTSPAATSATVTPKTFCTWSNRSENFSSAAMTKECVQFPMKNVSDGRCFVAASNGRDLSDFLLLYQLATPVTHDLGTIDLPYCTDTAYVDAMVTPTICVGWKTDNITAGGDEASYFTVPYPFGSDFTIFTSVQDGDDWGTNSLDVLSTNPLLKDPCHAWSWDGGMFMLEANNDNLVTERTLKPVYETNALNAREHESVSFAKTIGGEFSAKGMLLDNVTESTVEQLIALTKAQHVFYRAPSGETADVAIVGVSYTRHPEHVFVQVDMVEETV